MILDIVAAEDDDGCFASLKNNAERYARERGVTLHIKRYSDGEEFLSGYKGGADIIFMDIEMPYIDGYEATGRLRERDGNVIVVFVTNYLQYAAKGYALGVADFVLKPIVYNAFSAMMDRLVERIKAENDEFISLHTASGVVKVAVKDIMYVEVMGHSVTYHLPGREVSLWGSLTSSGKELPEGDFAKISSSYLVNLRYVEEAGGSYVCLGGDRLPGFPLDEEGVHAQAFRLSRGKGREKMIGDFFLEFCIYLAYTLETFFCCYYFMSRCERRSRFALRVSLCIAGMLALIAGVALLQFAPWDSGDSTFIGIVKFTVNNTAIYACFFICYRPKDSGFVLLRILRVVYKELGGGHIQDDFGVRPPFRLGRAGFKDRYMRRVHNSRLFRVRAEDKGVYSRDDGRGIRMAHKFVFVHGDVSFYGVVVFVSGQFRAFDGDRRRQHTRRNTLFLFLLRRREKELSYTRDDDSELRGEGGA